MAKVYARLIMKGEKTLANVPERQRVAVRAILEEAGFPAED